jgi:hypothetical protein
MKRGHWSATAAWAIVGLTSLALVSAAGANHSVTDRVSTGPAGGNGPSPASSQGISVDGSHVWFTTSERLVSADTDASYQDVYERVGGTTSLVSVGSTAGSPTNPPNASYAGAAWDGSRVFFTTPERLEPTDTDDTIDVYERSGGVTRLVSAPPIGGVAAAVDANFVAASEDGSRVFFRTTESLVAADTDGIQDIYERSGGTTTTLVSIGPTGGNSIPPVGGPATLDTISRDGTRAFFHTVESLVASDTDTVADVYERAGGTTTLISTGPGASGGNGPYGVSFAVASADGSRVIFMSDEALVDADADTCLSGPCNLTDIYERAGGTTTLVSTGPTGGNGRFSAFLNAVSQDATHVFFSTAEALVSGDTDNNLFDVYDRSGGTTTQISVGPTGGNGDYSVNGVNGLSADGTRAFFTTDERLVASDTDSTNDVYERAGGATSLVSTGPDGGNRTFAATFADVSADGSRVFFKTNEPLVSADTDAGASDVYERMGGTTTTLVSTGPTDPQGTQDSVFERISQDGTRAVFHTADRFVSADTDNVQDVYVASTGVTTGFPRPKGATPMFFPLVPVYEQCASGNTRHGAPFAFESCNPPVPTSRYLTVGTPDANGQGANSIGSVKLNVLPGNPSTPADEADITIAFSLTDVRKQGDLSDYAGELRAATSLRITDKLNGGSQILPGTVADMPFGFTVPCATTVSSTIGGTCALNTTLDALVGGGAVKESKRSIFKLVGDVEVYDGGADTDGDTGGDNTLFAGSGLFVP